MWEKEHLLAMVAASPSRCAVVELMLIFLGFGFVSLYHAIDIQGVFFDWSPLNQAMFQA